MRNKIFTFPATFLIVSVAHMSTAAPAGQEASKESRALVPFVKQDDSNPCLSPESSASFEYSVRKKEGLPAKEIKCEENEEVNLYDLYPEGIDSAKRGNKLLLKQIEKGLPANLSAKLEEDNDPSNASGWKSSRVIDANCIEWLCTNPEASKHVKHDGIHVRGARIDGKLDLSYAKIPFPLRFEKCVFTDDINLEQATMPALNLTGSHARSIQGKGLNTDGDVRLRANFKAKGQVCLAGATIGGYLDCSGGKFINRKRSKVKSVMEMKSERDRRNVALEATGISVSGNVSLGRGFEAVGVVSLYGAKIGRELDCKGGTFINPDWVAFNGDQMEVKGCVFQSRKEYSREPDDHFEAYGQVRLIGASIGGDLDCTKGRFITRAKTDDHVSEFDECRWMALRASRAIVKGDLLLRDGFEAVGMVELKGATIDGYFDCSGGKFINRKCSRSRQGMKVEHAKDRLNVALEATGVKVGGNVNLGNGFEAVGVVSLYGATIGREFDCKGGTFYNPDWVALNGDQMDVQGCVFQSAKEGKYSSDDHKYFKAWGQVRLIGASIGEDLECKGGQFTHPDPNEPCLRAEKIKVGGDVLLSEEFHATGKVSLAGAAIDGCLRWEVANHSDVSELDLGFAKIGTMYIEPKSANWPQKVVLNGLEYGEIDGKLADPDVRYDRLINWLELQYGKSQGPAKATPDGDESEPHRPQPYEQLAAALSQGGDADMARKVLVAMNKDRLKHKPQPQPLRRWLWYRMLGPMIDYGYNPLKIFCRGPFGCPFFGTIPFWLILGSGVFWIGKRKGKGKGKNSQFITPSDMRAYDEKGKLEKGYPKFNSFFYALDLFLPIIDLHQASYWLPNANVGGVLYECKRFGFEFRRGGLLRLYMWLHILFGWLLTVLLVAGLTGLVRT